MLLPSIRRDALDPAGPTQRALARGDDDDRRESARGPVREPQSTAGVLAPFVDGLSRSEHVYGALQNVLRGDALTPEQREAVGANETAEVLTVLDKVPGGRGRLAREVDLPLTREGMEGRRRVGEPPAASTTSSADDGAMNRVIERMYQRTRQRQVNERDMLEDRAREAQARVLSRVAGPALLKALTGSSRVKVDLGVDEADAARRMADEARLNLMSEEEMTDEMWLAQERARVEAEDRAREARIAETEVGVKVTNAQTQQSAEQRQAAREQRIEVQETFDRLVKSGAASTAPAVIAEQLNLPVGRNDDGTLDLSVATEVARLYDEAWAREQQKEAADIQKVEFEMRNLAARTAQAYASGRASDALAALRGSQTLTEAARRVKIYADAELTRARTGYVEAQTEDLLSNDSPYDDYYELDYDEIRDRLNGFGASIRANARQYENAEDPFKKAAAEGRRPTATEIAGHLDDPEEAQEVMGLYRALQSKESAVEWLLWSLQAQARGEDGDAYIQAHSREIPAQVRGMMDDPDVVRRAEDNFIRLYEQGRIQITPQGGE